MVETYRISVRTEDVRIVAKQIKHVIEEIALPHEGTADSVRLAVGDILKNGFIYSVPKKPITRYYPAHRIINIEVNRIEAK